MEVQGVLKQILPIESGESKSGKTWQKQTIIIETADAYPKQIAVEVSEKALSRLQD